MAKQKTNSVTRNEFVGDKKKLESGKKVPRPKPMQQSSKVEIMKQSKYISESRKGNEDAFSKLPPGVQEAVVRKEHIEKVTRPNVDNTPAGVKERLHYDSTPIDKKGAEKKKLEREVKMASLNKKSKSKSLDLTKLNNELDSADNKKNSRGPIIDKKPVQGKNETKAQAKKKQEALKPKPKASKPKEKVDPKRPNLK